MGRVVFTRDKASVNGDAVCYKDEGWTPKGQLGGPQKQLRRPRGPRGQLRLKGPRKQLGRPRRQMEALGAEGERK